VSCHRPVALTVTVGTVPSDTRTTRVAVALGNGAAAGGAGPRVLHAATTRAAAAIEGQHTANAERRAQRRQSIA
jgi:hypothetical protein